MNILDKVVENKNVELLRIKDSFSLEDIKTWVHKKKNFKEAITRRLSLIAEIKIKSPSEGRICEVEPMELLKDYESGGASAISVVTDNKFFGGSVDLLRNVAVTTELPVLRKDFIVDVRQIYESAYYGADAVLLIARIVNGDELGKFVGLARSVGLDSVVEVHNRDDLRKALASGSGIIGINNRNLDNFSVDINRTNELIGSIPDDIVVISESGINSRRDVLSLSERVNAILVGTSLIKSGGPAKKIMELMGDG